MAPAPENAPLAGLTIIELGTSVAAPFAGLILADLGARVIKVENPGKGDHARSWGPPFWGDTSSIFYALNRGKHSITVDLKQAGEVQSLRRLILEEADAVIQNLRPGLLPRLGLDADTLRAEKPALIWCDMGAFGAVGPWCANPGYDPLAQAATGIMSMTGEPDRPPVRVGVSLIDMGTGMWTVIGLLAALFARARGAGGARLETSLFETGLAWMMVPLAGYAANGEVRGRAGSGTAEIVPYQVFKTADNWLMIGAGNDGLFQKLCTALRMDALAQDPDFHTNAQRVRNRERLIGLLSAEIARYSTQDLGVLLDDAGVPSAPLLTVDQVAQHPQTQALGMGVQCDGDTLTLMGIPLSINGQRPRTTRAAPRLGEHNPARTDHG